MNVLAMSNDAAVRALVNPGRAPWWHDKNLVRLARRTSFRDCNEDEFDQAVAFCKEKALSPLSGQLFAFVFSKDDPKKRNMVIVTSIMGYRAIANRSGDYMPGAARAFFDANAKDPLTNPRGVVRAEATVERFIHGGWKALTEEAFWESYAPIIKTGADEDAYEWVDTGEKWEDTGKPKKRKRLRPGAEITLRLDPKKDGWIKMGDVMLKKCPEAAALRRGWPEDLSGLYVEEEMHRSQVIDADYVDMTPSEMASQAETDKRVELLGGPAIFATNERGILERVPVGKFADWVMAEIKDRGPDEVGSFIARNRHAINEFWAHNKTDALELKKTLEQRSAGAKPVAPAVASASQGGAADQPASPAPISIPAQGGAGEPIDQVGRGRTVEANRGRLKMALLAEIEALALMTDCFTFARGLETRIATLPPQDQADVRAAFARKQQQLNRD